MAGRWPRRALRLAAGAALLLDAWAATPAAAQTVAPVPLAGGAVAFAMHSTVIGAFTGRASVAHAEFTGNRLEAVRGFAEVRVADMRTGIAARDRHMREVMSADSFPVIRFDLVDVAPGATAGDTTKAVLEGRLTLDGVTHPVRADGAVVVRPDGVDVDARFVLDMRDYGIVPPVRALVLRVSPEVVVTVTLTFRAAGP